MKYSWSFHPAEYRVRENESFYSEKMRQGWELQKRGIYLSRFVKAEPRDMMYRLEIDSAEPTDEKLAIYEECGWEPVLRRGIVNIYRAPEGSGAPELYTDTEGQLRSVKRLLRGHVIDLALSVLLLGLLGVLFVKGRLSPGDFISSVITKAVLVPELCVFYAAGLIFAVVSELIAIVHLSRLIRDIKKGKEPDRSTRVSKPWGARLLVLTWALCVAVFILQLALHKKTDMPRVSDGPYITLSELGLDGERTGILGSEPNCAVRYDWSPLCGTVETRETVEHGGSWVSLDQNVYDLRVPGLAEPFAKGIIGTSATDRDIEDYDEISVPGWDKVYVAYMDCVAVRGGRVVRLYMLAPKGESMRSYVPEILRLIGGRGDEK